MPQRTHIPPIERDTFTYVSIRVAVRLIVIRWKLRTSASSDHHPTFVLALAGQLRLLFPSLYGPLVFVAKALAQGYTLSEIRRMSVEYAPRALHKRHIR